MENNQLMNIRLQGVFKALSPISHISESISINTYLVQEPIIQDDGTVEEVFCYSGNAWRGLLRDMAAKSMLSLLSLTVPLNIFHLLFAGGSIGSATETNIMDSRLWRNTIPMLSIFGGGVGNQILPGKMRTGNIYPICKETKPVIPDDFYVKADKTSYKPLTFEKGFTRMDNSKDDRLNHFINKPKALLESEKKKKDDDQKQQIRMEIELISAGTELYTEVDMLDASEIHIGVLVDAISCFSKSPYIGGQGNKGHGKVSLYYDIINLDNGYKKKPFLKIENGKVIDLSSEAKTCQELYHKFLKENTQSIQNLLEGKSK